MYLNEVVVIALLLVEPSLVSALPPQPLRLTIDCSAAGDRDSPFSRSVARGTPRFDVNSFCGLIRNAIPKAVKDGKFVLIEEPDQIAFSDTQVPFAVYPPRGFVPKLGLRKLKSPRVKVPKFKVPKLKQFNGDFVAPKVGTSKFKTDSQFKTPLSFSSLRDAEEDSSAERMEKFKNSVQKMLHVVKVLGQIDQYISERTRIIVEKLSKTFAD